MPGPGGLQALAPPPPISVQVRKCFNKDITRPGEESFQAILEGTFGKIFFVHWVKMIVAPLCSDDVTKYEILNLPYN